MRCGVIDYLRSAGPVGRGRRRKEALSLDAPIADQEDLILLDTIPAPEPEEPRLDRSELAAALASISDRERLALLRFYVEDVSAADVAGELGVSETRVHQLCDQAIGKARVALGLTEERDTTTLTERETQVLFCAAEGLSNEQTAENLSMAVETVKTHRKHLIKKLGARNMMQVLALAFRRGLLV